MLEQKPHGKPWGFKTCVYTEMSNTLDFSTQRMILTFLIFHMHKSNACSQK